MIDTLLTDVCKDLQKKADSKKRLVNELQLPEWESSDSGVQAWGHDGDRRRYADELSHHNALHITVRPVTTQH